MNARLAYIVSMIIFGAATTCVRFIDIPSSEIALILGFIGSSCFLPGIFLSNGASVFAHKLTSNAKAVLSSGFFLAGNWIFLFEAFRHTTIAVAALLYYTAPIFVLIFAALFLHEKISLRIKVSIAGTFIGMILLSDAAFFRSACFSGAVFGVAAALCYAGLTISNKFINGMNDRESTAAQLSLATLILIPYVFCTQKVSPDLFTSRSFFLLLALGIIHTGIGFYLFFYGVKRLRAQEIAIFGYIDPLVSVLLSLTVFREGMCRQQIFGAFVICASLLSGTLQKPERP